MKQRRVLDSAHVLPDANEYITTKLQDALDEVIAAVDSKSVVVVGMKGNPACKKARTQFSSRNIEHTYLEYGGYLSQWYPRLRIKQWSGWPLFPQVFVEGVLVGGSQRTKEAFASGLIPKMLEAGRSDVLAVVAAEQEAANRG